MSDANSMLIVRIRVTARYVSPTDQHRAQAETTVGAPDERLRAIGGCGPFFATGAPPYRGARCSWRRSTRGFVDELKNRSSMVRTEGPRYRT